MLTAAFGLAAGAVANAATLASTAAAATLLGTWAIDCSKPASPQNWYITYEAAANGGVRAIYDTGPPLGSLTATVESLNILSPTIVAMRLRKADPKWGKGNDYVFNLILEVGDKRRIPLQSVRSDGVVYIADGRQIANGRPADVHERCVTTPLS